MRSSYNLPVCLALSKQAFATAYPNATTLASICTNDYVKSSLPSDGVLPGVIIDSQSVTTNAFYNVSVTGSSNYPDGVYSYCNATFAYSHAGLNDRVLVTYWLPAPADFKGRYLSTGGGGYAINSGSQSLPGGILYGAVAGLTDGGFGGFNNQVDAVAPLANGTNNWQANTMWGYQAIHEMSIIGKNLTDAIYNMGDEKLYSYYQGCSEGGREGWSQVQRYGAQFDGAVIGAPAFRFAFQQVQHLWSNIVERDLDYYPPPCELEKIMNETISACDALDGKVDGVVSRTDLCILTFNINSTLGKAYSCPASAGNPRFGQPGSPAQNGTVTAKGIEVVLQSQQGIHDSDGKRVYFSYQPSSSYDDAQTKYNPTTQQFELAVTSLGGEWVERWINLLNASNLPDLNGVTRDTLKEWIRYGLQTYESTLHTAWPDLTPFREAGGKVLHYHGESDYSIPTASSVRYHESVREIMYPGMSYNESNAALNEWYKLYLVPGAGHCAPNAFEPNGPFPQTNLAVMIDWVEKGIEPTTLNATVLQGEHVGENQQICQWPLRPLWVGNGTSMECVYDQASIDTWHYDLDAFDLPIY